MPDSRQDPKRTSWRQRLTGIFKRNKTSAPKEKKEVTSADRDKRSFTISLVIGTLILLSFINYLFANNGKELTLSDLRVLNGLLATACFISAWLSRKGKTPLGATLILAVLYWSSSLTVVTTGGSGALIGAFNVGLTLAFTSAVMTPTIARRVNIAVLVLATAFILLDVFEPFPRTPDPNPGLGTVIVVIAILVFAAIVIRRFFTYNLRTKLIIAFAGVTIVPLFFITLFDNNKLSDLLTQDTQKNLSLFANQTATHVDTFIENQLTSIAVASKNPPFIDFLSINPAQRTGTKEEENAQKALKALVGQNVKFINTYALLDQAGNVVLKTAQQSQQDNNQAQFFKQVSTKKQAAVSGPLIDQKTGKAALYFSAPIQNAANATIGTLVAEYNADVIESLLNDLIAADNPNGTFFHIVSTDNFIRIADTSGADVRYKSYKDYTANQVKTLQQQGALLPGTTNQVLTPKSEIVAGLTDLNQSALFSTPGDKATAGKDFNSGTHLKSVPWVAFVSQSESAILAPLTQQKRTSAGIFIILLLLVTLAAFGLSQLLASPILSLATVAQKIAAGDLTLQSDIESNDEIGTLAAAFNQMTRQTRALINSLEQRSKALATSSEVSRRISTILDQQELVTEVVKQVKNAFNYYHAHIYLLDESKQELIMAGGTGEAGKAMLARGHKIPVGKGLVGRAAQNNITVLVTNVAEDPQWLPNPLLPNTKSEVAVPIAIAERVLGVLDVQHDVADILKQEDVDVLQSIANQVAFAVRNARSYSEVQAKADRESLISSIGQKIQGTITVESAMQVAIREIGRALNGSRTQVMLNENFTNETIVQTENDTTQSL